MKRLDAALLRTLRESPVHLPLREIADQLGATVPVLQARLTGLRDAGFVIEARPGIGYALVGTPDRLIADDLIARLNECDFIRDIIVFEETDSTNNHVSTLGRNGAPGGVVVFAERQTAGRGRFGRRWDSASHLGLWFSVLLRPELPISQWPRLTTWAAVGIAAGIEILLGVRVGIKWPNDVLFDGRKVAGVLIETGCDAAQRPFAAVGIGINANHQAADFPAELAASAGSIRQINGDRVDRSELAVAVLHALASRLPLLGDGRFDQLIAEAELRSVLLGSWIQVREGGQTFEGVAEQLDPNGCLLLRDEGGQVRRLSAAEVTLKLG